MHRQAQADALGRWNSGAAAADGQREWENDGRVDLRSVTSAARQLPYHLARQHQHRCLKRSYTHQCCGPHER